MNTKTAKEALYQGKTVDIVEVKGGWTTILDGMTVIKVRNGELSPLKAVEPAKPAKPAKAAVESDEGEGDDVDARLIKADLTRYVTTPEVKTASGRVALDNADRVAIELRGLDLSEVYRTVANVLGVTQVSLKDRYGHLNAGMQRMNLGNRLRKAYRHAE